MINLAKIYLDELKYFQTFLYEIQNQGFPNWREDMKLGTIYQIAPPINEVKKFEECVCVNLEPHAAFDHLYLLTQDYKNQVSEIVLLQFDLVTFTILKENYIFVKSGVMFVFNFELFQKAEFAKKTIVSKCFAPSTPDYPNYLQKMIDNVEYIAKHVHLNLLIVPEVSGDEDLKRMTIIDLPNTVFIGQKMKFFQAINIEFQYWLLDTAWVNTKSWLLHRQLNLTNPFETKKLYFDCLFGRAKKTRMSFYKKMVEHKLDKLSFIATHDWPHVPNSISYPKKFLEVVKSQNPKMKFSQHPVYENRVILENLNSTVDKLRLDNVNLSFSQMLDIDIYNHAAYSVIFETLVSENNQDTTIKTFFVTEKTCKPILAKRLFFVYGAPFYLKYLHSLGFKTFDGIIDESYDSILSEDIRENFIVNEMKKLTEIDQSEIYSKIRPIVEHNYNQLFKLVFEENTSILLDQFR